MMHKFILILLLFVCADGKEQFLNDTNENDTQISTVSLKDPKTPVFVEFYPAGSEYGIVHVSLPNEQSPRPICYPANRQQNTEAFKLIHVLCRQYGHVTFDMQYKDDFKTPQRSLLVNSAHCTGREDSVSECTWKRVKNKMCLGVLSTRCSYCNYKFLTSHGAVHNPGYPYTYFYSLICEWLIEIPEDGGIELYFEEFALPRSGNDDCEAYVELTYGHRKWYKMGEKDRKKELTYERICASEKVSIISVPFRSVRIRFVSGVFKPEYDIQKTHYGLHITYSSVPFGAPSNNFTKLFLITGIVVIIIIAIMCCYCCQYNLKYRSNRGTNQATFTLPPDCSTAERNQDASNFQKRTLQAAQEEIPKNAYMDFAIYQSDDSSTDSCITRWRSEKNLPVTSALAPVGPDARTISIATTPRSVFPKSCRTWSEESARRIEKARTKLIARFSSTSTHNASDVSVFFPSSERRTYSRLSCEEDIPLHTLEAKEGSTSAATCSKIPDIVVEFVN